MYIRNAFKYNCTVKNWEINFRNKSISSVKVFFLFFLSFKIIYGHRKNTCLLDIINQ